MTRRLSHTQALEGANLPWLTLNLHLEGRAEAGDHQVRRLCWPEGQKITLYQHGSYPGDYWMTQGQFDKRGYSKKGFE